MTFNVMSRNYDDHTKNFGFLLNPESDHAQSAGLHEDKTQGLPGSVDQRLGRQVFGLAKLREPDTHQ